jgi:hypothetical protein
MIGDYDISIWTAAEVDAGAPPVGQLPPLAEVLAWARSYLVTSNPDLGRPGPVCPYTQPSLHKGLFHLAALTDPDTDANAAVERLRDWYERLAGTLSTSDQELLTILLVLPHLDPADSGPLDVLQRKAKDQFVASGLMIGQFHPTCDEPGLWNHDFKALRAPVPLLAVRKLVVFDLPFVLGTQQHAESYLRRFAPAIPPRIRDQLVRRAVT